jgi:hypothetical protein
MIKVQNNIATREPLPTFLQGLAPESLADLSWTDPQLGVQGCAWWPAVDKSAPLDLQQRYGAELLTVDAENRVVIVTREVLPLGHEELRQAAATAAQALMARTSEMRWQHETGGINIDAVRVATAIEDQNRITSVVANAVAAGVEAVDFKAESGWVSLSLSELQAIACAIARHVQACFTAERSHHDAIQALAAIGDVAGLAAYNVEEGWPQ